MSKTTKRKTNKANGRTAAQRAREDDRRELQREVRAEHRVRKLATELRRAVFGRDAALENLTRILSERQSKMDAAPTEGSEP